MKLLCSSADQAEIGLLKGMLDKAGIPCEIRNEFTHAYYPGAEFYPELWVLSDDDFLKASELHQAWRAPSSAEPSAWDCPHCGEHLEGQFLSCWKCGADHDHNTE